MLDFIPAVGDIDAFIKVPRPDGTDEELGKKILDEPSAQQSDPSVLELTLRALSRQTTSKEVNVKKVSPSGPHLVEQWIRDLSDLHRSKGPPTVVYRDPTIQSSKFPKFLSIFITTFPLGKFIGKH